jgi:hypothetical protein
MVSVKVWYWGSGEVVVEMCGGEDEEIFEGELGSATEFEVGPSAL